MCLSPPLPQWLRLLSVLRVVVLLLLIYYLMCFPLFMGILCFFVLLCVHSSFEIILKRKRKLVALILLSYRCIVTISALWLFLTVLLVGLQCAIVVFPDHTHLRFANIFIST